MITVALIKYAFLLVHSLILWTTFTFPFLWFLLLKTKFLHALFWWQFSLPYRLPDLLTYPPTQFHLLFLSLWKIISQTTKQNKNKTKQTKKHTRNTHPPPHPHTRSALRGLCHKFGLLMQLMCKNYFLSQAL